MKKQLFLLSLLGAMMAGCSSEDTIKSNDDLPEGYTNSYLSISVIGANSAGTRAADEEYEEGDGTYQDGTEEENHVATVRFFFFDENGAAAMVHKTTAGTYLSYMDIENPATGDENHDETVEKIVETTLRLNIPEGRKNPSMVLAVINPTEDIKNLPNPSLNTLKAQIRNFKIDGSTELTKNNFVMSNSVYVDNDETAFDAEILTADNFQISDEAAEAHPVKIYVERVLARLDFSLADLQNDAEELSDGTIIYKLDVPGGSKDENYYVNGDEASEETSGYEDIYVKFKGWNITGTPKKSRLIKEVNNTWTSEDIFGESSMLRWSIPYYHRSFWALNPDLGKTPVFEDYTGTDINYEFVSFNDASLSLPEGKTYLQENANKYSEAKTAAAPDYATKVFIAAQLVDKNGEALNLVKWLNGYYTVKGAKKAMANTLDIYTEGANGAYVKITPEDLTLGKASGASHGYYAIATVNTEKTWYEKVVGETGEDEYKKLEDVNSYIYTKLGYALVWETGETYYFFDIRHLGEEGSIGYNGIVRNHIYKTSITSVAGLGTPVYDPDEDIYPEIPEKECIISAKVNILSWRVVTSEYNLVW